MHSINDNREVAVHSSKALISTFKSTQWYNWKTKINIFSAMRTSNFWVTNYGFKWHAIYNKFYGYQSVCSKYYRGIGIYMFGHTINIPLIDKQHIYIYIYVICNTYLNIIPPCNDRLKANQSHQFITEFLLQMNFKQVNSVQFWTTAPLCRCLPWNFSKRTDWLGFPPVFVDFYQASSKPCPQVESHKFLQHMRNQINLSSHYEVTNRQLLYSYLTKYMNVYDFCSWNSNLK